MTAVSREWLGHEGDDSESLYILMLPALARAANAAKNRSYEAHTGAKYVHQHMLPRRLVCSVQAKDRETATEQCSGALGSAHGRAVYSCEACTVCITAAMRT